MHHDDYDRCIAPMRTRMVNCIWRIVRHPEDTDDVLQEALIHVFNQFDNIRIHPNPEALILRICTQKALDFLRRQKTRRNINATAPSEDITTSAQASTNATPREAAATTEQREELLAFISELPRREAEAITLHALDEMEYPQIAVAMNCAETTARVLVNRARARFRTHFKNINATP